MTIQDDLRTCLEVYGRYLDVLNNHSYSAEVPVATFASWLGKACGDSGMGSVGLSVEPLLRANVLVDSLASSKQGGCDGERDERVSSGTGVIGGFDCSEDIHRVEVVQLDGRVKDEDSSQVKFAPAAAERVVDSGGQSADGSRGPNWERNRVWALEKKNRKARRKVTREGEIGGDSLRASSVNKWRAENDLAAERAVRNLAALRAVSIEDQIRSERIRRQATNEKNMVSIEKTHKTLAATGNVPGDMTGFAATIVGSGSISPDSSASGHEFRQCQKALIDAQAEVEALKGEIARGGISEVRPDDIWTMNTENKRILDDSYSYYVEQSASMYGYPGKSRIVPC